MFPWITLYVSNFNQFHEEFARVWSASSSVGRKASRHSQNSCRSLIQASSSALEQTKCCWEKKSTSMKTNMDPKMMVSNKDLLLQNSIFRCHVRCCELYHLFVWGCSLSQSQWAHNIIDHHIFFNWILERGRPNTYRFRLGFPTCQR